MTEISYFWDGTDTGDAPDEYYDNAEFQKIFGLLAVFDPTQYGIIRTWGDEFEITGLSQPSLTFTIKTGRAIVGNALYESNANISYTLTAPASGYYYFTLVLRKDIGAQTVRQVMLGPSVSYYPSPVQTSSVWDFPLAEFIVYQPFGTYWTIGGGLGGHRYIHPDGSKLFPIIKRLGGDASNWSTPGTTQYDIALEATMQTGIAKWLGSDTDGNVAVTFPFAFDSAPIVFLGNPDYNNSCAWETTQIITVAYAITSVGFSLYWKSLVGASRSELHLTWMAIGPRAIR